MLYYFLEDGGLRRKSVMRRTGMMAMKLGQMFLIMSLGLSLQMAINQEVQAAGEFRPTGGRSAGMCGISVAIQDQWSACNNQAANAWNEGIICGVFFENRYLLKELSYKAVFFSACLRPGSFSFTCHHFGTSIYSELKTGLAYARKFGKRFSAGVQFNYYRFNVPEDYDAGNFINFETGLLFRPVKQLTIGFHCVNPVPVKISAVSGEFLPALYQLGLTWIFSEELFISAEISKGPSGKASLIIGGEYRMARILFARAGVSTGPFNISLGAGLLIGRFSVDLASAYNQFLGYSPSLSIQYRFTK